MTMPTGKHKVAVKRMKDARQASTMICELMHSKVNFSLVRFIVDGQRTIVFTLFDHEDFVNHHVHFNGFQEVDA